MNLASRMQEGDVQKLGGWRDRAMLRAAGRRPRLTERSLRKGKLALGNKW
jgi:hypothetical protein